MARTTNRPSTGTRPDTATTPLDTNGSASFDGPGLRGESGRLGDNAEGRENLTAVRNDRDDSRDDRDDSRDDRDESRGNRAGSRGERGNRNSRDGREFGDNRDERMPRDGDAEQGPTPSAGLDAFAPVLEAWKQVFKSWSELTETMVKVQQDAFASMIGAANATAKNVKDENHRNGEFAFAGSRSTASRTTASAPARIEHDRR